MILAPAVAGKSTKHAMAEMPKGFVAEFSRVNLGWKLLC